MRYYCVIVEDKTIKACITSSQAKDFVDGAAA
jgi:hypothetical protein